MILVFNKSDEKSFKKIALKGFTSVSVSAKTGQGVDSLKNEISVMVASMMPAADKLMVSVRHAEALGQTIGQLGQALELLRSKADPALIAHHLHAALNHFGEILGRFDNEEILDKLFGEFCIGK